MLGPININLEEFGVSSKNGFLPDQLPLQRLSSPYYQLWEQLVQRIPELLAQENGSLRLEISKIPILVTDYLDSEAAWQRAYLLLSYLTHAHLWELPGPCEVLPPQISTPILEVATQLGLPPTATYAAFNLWNFKPINSEGSLSDVDNLRSLHTFTGTRDEEWFYLISVAIEAKGAPLIPSMLRAMDAVRLNDPGTVTVCLNNFAETIMAISKILKRMREHCNPDVFYHKIRPFLAGSKNMGVAGLKHGLFYDEGNGNGEWRQYSGGSNAQSSLIQFFDIILGIEHRAYSSPTNTSSPNTKNFLTTMRSYMPGSHRSFLTTLESQANIRAFVAASSNPELTVAYNRAVSDLVIFRTVHMSIVQDYIKIPSEKTSPAGSGLNLAIGSAGKGGELKGTGGTKLMPFLEGSRKETREARITRSWEGKVVQS